MRTAGVVALAGIIAASSCRSPDQVGLGGEPPRDAQHAEAARLLKSSRGHRYPVPVYIDGRRYVQPVGHTEFNIIDPHRIATIQLLTGPAAEARAGAEGRGGVIWITTKEAATAH